MSRLTSTITITEFKKIHINIFCSKVFTIYYVKCNENDVKKIIKIEKEISLDLDLDERMDVPSREESYVTLKDHKPNYKNHPTFRLVNPNKGQIGRISKIILENVNQNLRSKLDCKQWRNTADVIKWFNDIEEKQRCHFTQFDIVEFYPNISEKLLLEALNFAKQHT